MKIESTPKKIKATDCDVFLLLSDLTNFETLFPQEKIENWKATKETCSFKIKGLSEVGLKIVALTPNSLVYIDSTGKSPFKFTLNFYLESVNQFETNVKYIFDANINPFMKMMAEKPLTEFFNSFIDKLNTNFL